MRTTYYLTLLFALLIASCQKKPSAVIPPSIIPKPLSQTTKEGTFVLHSNTSLSYDASFKEVANYFSTFLKETYKLSINETNKNGIIQFVTNTEIKHEEEYYLTITPQKIKIESKTTKGAFYGVQSLLQLLPIKTISDQIGIPCLAIKDKPQFVYRGMHLDVGRHFFPVAFVKKYIDMMAMLKMNTFHWHLTEDQGWRIEIKKYPKLQEIAAYRKETLIGHYNDQPHKFDGKKYGGYYTQEEVKEIVAYASERQITVIPEIEMPGHSQAAIAAYPELGCTDEPVEVATKWGVFEDIYCPNEATFTFLEDVIDEVIALFPSKYIHIGGDEAPKTKWKNSKFCQQFIKKNKLKDEHGLQSYFITRMEKYINSKGKQIIGWDEILEGGLAPNATVMSWRGIEGAIEAAKQHHDVILTPGSHCYFDHYQSTNDGEPLAIGGFLPLEKVYNFNPIPEELTPEEAKYVLGTQGNVWTEYMKTTAHVEYMVFPRILALSEVAWTNPANKNFENFKSRLPFYLKRLDHFGINYANHLYELSGTVDVQKEKVTYSLKSDTAGKTIRYTLDNTPPSATSTLYEHPITIDEDTTIQAASFDNQEQISSTFVRKINKHKAIGKKITLSVPPNEAYNAGGKEALINGINGHHKRFGDKEWLGFKDDSLSITIDLGDQKEISSLTTRFHNGKGQWIYAPKKITVYLDDVKITESLIPISEDLTVTHKTTWKAKKAQLVKIVIPNYGKIEQGKQGGGHKAWLFIDELIIK